MPVAPEISRITAIGGVGMKRLPAGSRNKPPEDEAEAGLSWRAAVTGEA